MANSSFRIQAQVVTPHFEAEHRYIMLEKELATAQLAAAKRRPWLWFKVSSLNLYTERDWKAYLRQLDKYSSELAKHKREIRDGLVPVHLTAVNNSHVQMNNPTVRIVAEDGVFKPKKKPPKRPTRMDGAADKAQKHHFRLPTPGGFARRHIRLGSKSMQVTFNRLAPYDSALVVRQVLYVDSSAKTRLHYDVLGSGRKELASGSIRVPRAQ